MRVLTCLRPLLPAALLLLATVVPAPGQAPPTDAAAAGPEPAAGRDPARQQDSVRLNRLTSGVMPPDGLLTVGLGLRHWSAVYLVDDGSNEQLRRVGLRDYFLLLEAVPLPWLDVHAELPWRTWSDGTGWIPPSGSGLGDGRWQATLGTGLVPGLLHVALHGGGNLPVGDEGAGLGEGVFSPRAGVALTLRLWPEAQVPETRLHLNAARTWNRNESDGYGMGTTLLQPWPPRYQSAAAAGGKDRNDALTWGAALEIRQGTASLWLEYARDSFLDNDTVAPAEELATVGAGLRWGLSEGWAVEGGYLVSLADDDEGTDWWPAFPDWSMRVAVARQFPVGGRDRDGDGIVDRKDRCPEQAEDVDGYRDDDGCPDLDNDRDGIPDVRDGAPDLAEDLDGFADEDGVPDPDNDGDGIPDREDLCPDEPEDMDGHHDDDGCPDVLLDSDGDGVEDGRDGCPDQAEDHDGFEDDDGCPEPDNDLDGIPDAEDDCPDEPENYNGTADRDGCPD